MASRMDHTEEFDSAAALRDLLEWAFGVLGATWSGGVDADGIAHAYRSRRECRLDPWPAIGLELHMPRRRGERGRVDFSLMAWEAPGVLASPVTWAFDDTVARMRVAPTHRFLEFDAPEGDIHEMGEFFSVTDAAVEAFPAGILRDLRRALGRAPTTAALIEGRGPRSYGALFPMATADDWDRMADVVGAASMGVAGAAQLAAMQVLMDTSRSANVGIVVGTDHRVLPAIGFEFFGLKVSNAISEALATAGVPEASIEAFAAVAARLPELATRNLPIVAGSPLDLPWQQRYLHLSHAKVNCRPDGVAVKWYVRIDTAAPGGFTTARPSRSRNLVSARAELRRSLRAGFATGSVALDSLRDKSRWSAITVPIVRGLWNEALARVPVAELPLFGEVARDAVVAAGLSRLETALGDTLLEGAAGALSEGARLLRDIGIADSGADDPTAGPLEALVQSIRSGTASSDIMEHVEDVVIPMAVDWIEDWRDTAHRVAADRSLLFEQLGIPCDAPLVRVDADAGDRHAGGRAVHLLWFAVDGGEIGLAYKPRDLRADAAWYALATELMSALGATDIPWPSVLVREGYGYVTLVGAGEVVDETLYARNAGRLLALLHLCDVRDIHSDNVIQTPLGPIPIDLECLWSGADDERLAHDGVPAGSIAATGYLPYWIRSREGRWTNGGGVRMSDGSSSVDVSLGYPPTRAPALYDGRSVRVGFEEMYRYAMTAAGAASLRRCRSASIGAIRRRLLRSTRIYATLRRELALSAPGRTHRAAALAALRDRLSGSSGRPSIDEADVTQEIDSLGRGDIPRLVAPIALADVGRTASEADLAWQRQVLAGGWVGDTPSWPSVVRRLVADWRVAPDGRKGWWGWDGTGALGVRQLRFLPWTLYGGSLGPTLALAVGRSRDDEPSADATLRQAIAEYTSAAVASLGPAHVFRWGFDGFAGHLRAIEALLALEVPDDGGLKRVRDAWLVAALRASVADAAVDFTTGLAGTMGPLCRLWEETHDDAARELLERIGVHLAGRAPGLIANPSLAHGRAGVGLALIEAGRIARRGDWIETAVRLWEERTIAAPSVLPLSWCRGLSGIALSRWIALERLPDHPEARVWRRVVDDAIPVLHRDLRPADDPPNARSLCCGVLGHLATLRILSAALAPRDWDAIERALAQRARSTPPGLWSGISGLVLARQSPPAVLARLIA